MYELDGKEVSLSSNAEIGIDSHWNMNEFVVLVIVYDGKEHRQTVSAADLKRAIENATNHK